jgi:hypothetical protein
MNPATSEPLAGRNPLELLMTEPRRANTTTVIDVTNGRVTRIAMPPLKLVTRPPKIVPVTRARARCQLQGRRRPGARRTVRAGAPPGDPDLADDPEPPGGRSAGTYTYAVLSASERGEVVA